jgi:hypothetical protein
VDELGPFVRERIEFVEGEITPKRACQASRTRTRSSARSIHGRGRRLEACARQPYIDRAQVEVARRSSRSRTATRVPPGANAIGITFAEAGIVSDHIVTRAQGKREDSRVLEGT